MESEFTNEILETVREPLLVLDHEFRVLNASQNFYRFFHVTPKEIKQRLLFELGDGEWDNPKLRELLEQILPQNATIEAFELEHDFPRIGQKTLFLNARRILIPGKRNERILLAIEDVTERKNLESQKLDALRFTALILETVREPLIVLNNDLRVNRASLNFYRFFRTTPQETEGRLLFALGDGEWDNPNLRDLLEKILPENATIESFELEHDFPSLGSRLTLMLNARRVEVPGKTTETILLAVEDITERKKLEKEVRRLALTDPLTGLANRNHFNAALENGIRMGRRFNQELVLLFLDLDKFKQVNDTFGHPVGDALLQAVSKVLAKGLREVDTVARLGGDEFAVILEGIHKKEDAERLAQRYVDGLGQPFELMGHVVTIGVSVGLACFPKDADHAADLMRRADLALYQAKEEGRGTFCTFTPALDS